MEDLMRRTVFHETQSLALNLRLFTLHLCLFSLHLHFSNQASNFRSNILFRCPTQCPVILQKNKIWCECSVRWVELGESHLYVSLKKLLQDKNIHFLNSPLERSYTFNQDGHIKLLGSKK